MASDYDLAPSGAVRCLGIMIDRQRNFRKHANAATSNAIRVMAALNRVVQRIKSVAPTTTICSTLFENLLSPSAVAATVSGAT